MVKKQTIAEGEHSDDYVELTAKSYYNEDSKVIPYEDIKKKGILGNLAKQFTFSDKRKKPKTGMNIPIGAAGIDRLPTFAFDIFEVNDPYPKAVRDMFTDCALTDPILRTGLTRRKASTFADGYHLELELVSSRHPQDGHLLEDREKEIFIKVLDSKFHFNKIVGILEDWANKSTIDMLTHLKEHQHLGVVQGRALSLIIPPVHKLQQGMLPHALLRVPAEETGNVIINRGLLRIIGVRFFSTLIGSGIALPDGMIYSFQHNSGLKRNEEYYGRSEMEPLIQLSRINKKIINSDYAKAVRAAYFGKIASAQVVSGTEVEKQKILNDRMKAFTERGADVFFYEAFPDTNFEVFKPEVAHDMIEKIRNDIDKIMIPAMGSTQLKMGNTENLSRDNATIMEVQEIREVRTPDEDSIAKFFEQQLFNPLLAHLMRVPLATLPVQVKIVRNPPNDETNLQARLEQQEGGEQGGMEKTDPMQDQRIGQQSQKLESHLVQPNQNVAGLGASGDILSPVYDTINRYNRGEITNEQCTNILKSLKSNA